MIIVIEHINKQLEEVRPLHQRHHEQLIISHREAVSCSCDDINYSSNVVMSLGSSPAENYNQNQVLEQQDHTGGDQEGQSSRAAGCSKKKKLITNNKLYYYMNNLGRGERMMRKLCRTFSRTSWFAKFHYWIVQLTCTLLLLFFLCRLFYFFSGNGFRAADLDPLPPERIYESNGYLMVSANGGLNQMRAGICDMVAIASSLNATLIVPQLDNTSFWNDQSQFGDVFDVDHFIRSLRDEVKILKQLPEDTKQKIVDSDHSLYSMPPVSWSNMSYYHNKILPKMESLGFLHLNKTDSRLANNGIPQEVQKLRCKVNYEALRFTSPIQNLAQKIVTVLREKGQFMVLHLRYEKDMLAFTGCNQGCSAEEARELRAMRYAYKRWKVKEIDSDKARREGSCPLTPEETALVLQALDIDPRIQIYVAAGDIYGGERRLADLRKAFPRLVNKETLLAESDLARFRNHSNQMAALDYHVAVEADIFAPTYGGNMAKVVEGHRRYLGYRKTIMLNQKAIVELIDEYENGEMSWENFSAGIKEAHSDRMGQPSKRVEIPGHPKDEDYFYTNPQECLA